MPSLPGCVVRGRSVEECLERARLAIEGCLRELIAFGGPVPRDNLRRWSLNLLKAESSVKAGIKGERLKCGWNHDYLLLVLTGSGA